MGGPIAQRDIRGRAVAGPFLAPAASNLVVSPSTDESTTLVNIISRLLRSRHTEYGALRGSGARVLNVTPAFRHCVPWLHRHNTTPGCHERVRGYRVRRGGDEWADSAEIMGTKRGVTDDQRAGQSFVSRLY